jgi:outer membrane receptor protein involved in Fe transport
MKKIVLLFLIGLLSYQLKAQNSEARGVIRGVIADSSNNEKVAYATVSIKIEGAANLRSALSKEDGSFIIEKIPNGKHQLTILNVGYKKWVQEVSISDENPSLNLGTVLISSSDNRLQEVQITTDKPLVKQEVDRISYDVQSDPESKFQTALDMLRKVPLVSVDADDNIQVKGSGNFKVLINGRPSSLVARNPRDVFKAMPASSIVKIEVITNPPAKYDAEGLAGIINIITTKKLESGYNGSVSSRYNFPWGPGVSASLTLKKNKFAMSGYYGNGYQDIPQTGFNSSRIGILQATTLLQNGTNKNFWFWQYVESEMSYEFDTLNLLTATIGTNPGYGNTKSIQTNSLYNGTGAIDQSFVLTNNGQNDWNGTDIGLNFQHGFKKNKDQLLTLSYKYSPSTNNNENNVSASQNINYNFNPFKQKNESGTKEQTYQMDYVHPIKKVDVEAGVKAILRNNYSSYSQHNFDPNFNDYVYDSTNSNNFDYQQNVYSFYNSYNIKLDKWGFRLGVRVEKTTVDADFETTATKVKQDYTNVIPSVSVQRKFKDMSSMNLGYTQRIERPSIWELNPFVNQQNPRFLSFGNPNLEAVLTNNFEIGYSTFKKGSINVGASYSFANNTIQNVTSLGADTISRDTYENIGKDRKLGFNANISYPINKKLNVNLNALLSYIWIEGTFNSQFYTNEGFQGNAFTYISYTLPKDFRARVNMGYYSPWILLQGQSNNFIYSSFSLSKDFLDKKMTVSAQVSNPWKKFRDWEQNFNTAQFIQTSNYQNFYRNYGCSISYRFGKLDGGVKKNQRGISNDDVKGKSGGGQGG